MSAETMATEEAKWEGVVEPGKFEDVTKLYKYLAAPVYDKLVADGAIQDYGLNTAEVNRGEKWTHMSWYASKDLAARDVVRKAFDAAAAARTEAENEALGKRFNESLDSAGHSDQILMVVHYKMKSAE